MVFLFIFRSSFVVYFVMKERAENGVLELWVGEGKMGLLLGILQCWLLGF